MAEFDLASAQYSGRNSANPHSFTHTPGTNDPICSVLVLVVMFPTVGTITGVTYGGVALTQVPGSPQGGGESGGYVAAYHLGDASAIPTGPQTVVVSKTGGSSAVGVITNYGTIDTEVVDTDATGVFGANPSVSLVHGGRLALDAAAEHSGVAGAFTGFNAPTILIGASDSGAGSNSGRIGYRVASTSDQTIDTSIGSDDVAMIGVAVGQIAAGGVEHSLSGTAAGASDVVADLSVARSLAGLAAGAGAAVGNIAVARSLAGLTAGSATVMGSLARAVSLAGLTAGDGDAVGALRRAISLAGQSDGTSDAEGALSFLILLSGSAAGSGSASGNLAVARKLAGVAAGDAQAQANLQVARSLAGSSAGATALAGAIGVARALAGGAHGSGVATGSLSLVITLRGSADGASDVSGILRRAVALVGAADGDSFATAILSIERTDRLTTMHMVLEESESSAVVESESTVVLQVSETGAEIVQ